MLHNAINAAYYAAYYAAYWHYFHSLQFFIYTTSKNINFT